MSMQGPEQEQLPHFFGWLQRQQKSARRPLSAAPRPTSGSGSVNGHGNGNISASLSIRRSSSSLRPWSPVADVQDMHGKQQQQQHQQQQLLQRPHSPVPDSHRRINSNSNRPSRPSSPQQAARQKRPASAAPNLLVSAQRLQAPHATPLNGPSGRPARPFSAAPSRGSAKQQQLSSLLQQQQQAQPPRWQQQQQLVQMQQGLSPQCRPARGLVAGAASTTATPAHTVDPMALPVRANSANPRLTQQQQQQTQSQQQSEQQQQQDGEPSQHTASPQQAQYCPGSSRPSAQLCCAGSALLTPAWLRPSTATAEPNLRATASSPTGSCCSSRATAAGRTSPCHTSRPSSPLGHNSSSYRVSRPTSPACCRPGSTARTAAGGVSSAAVVSSSPWLSFGSDAPLVWLRVSTPDTLRRLQQQQQQQGVGEQQQQQEYDACQQQQQGELLPVQQQQQQQCWHQSALQLFRQLPLSGAAAHSSVTREALQQMALGLQLELQRVGAPLDLLAPPLVAHYSSHDSSGGPEGTQAAMAAHTAAAVSAGLGTGVLVGWSALEQVGPELAVWQVLVSELVRQNLLECSQRGQLLQAATDRQQQLLHQTLSCCDELYRVLLQCSARQLQQQGEMSLAQHEAVALQQECNRLKALLDSKQAKLVATAVELEQQQERMRRGRFHLIHEQVQEARMEIEKRVLRDLEAQVLKARTAAQAEADALQEVLLKAVQELAGQEVAEAVQAQLESYQAEQQQQQQMASTG